MNRGMLGKQAFYDLPWLQCSEQVNAIFMIRRGLKDGME